MDTKKDETATTQTTTQTQKVTKPMFYHEQAAAEKLGLSKETLRHWRVGYTVTSKGKRYAYPPKIKDGEGTTWKKEFPTRFSPILWDADFVDNLASALTTQRIAMGDLKP
jgi:hypothetical protein